MVLPDRAVLSMLCHAGLLLQKAYGISGAGQWVLVLLPMMLMLDFTGLWYAELQQDVDDIQGAVHCISSLFA